MISVTERLLVSCESCFQLAAFTSILYVLKTALNVHCLLCSALLTVLIDNLVHHFCCRFGMLANKKTMNSKKRKADEDEESCDIIEEGESKDCENETANLNDFNCGKDECGNSVDQQKSDNGGSSDRPGTSDNKTSEDNSKDLGEQISEQREKKLTVSNHVLLFTERIKCA